MKEFGAVGCGRPLDKRLLGCSGGNVEDRDAERNVDSRDLAYQVSKDPLRLVVYYVLIWQRICLILYVS